MVRRQAGHDPQRTGNLPPLQGGSRRPLVWHHRRSPSYQQADPRLWRLTPAVRQELKKAFGGHHGGRGGDRGGRGGRGRGGRGEDDGDLGRGRGLGERFGFGDRFQVLYLSIVILQVYIDQIETNCSLW
uniref:Uncharacterized protein n=1 Tax=Plectus sambesii TaxID=2011161 RepID=A0A914XFW5_9BILA